MFLYKHILFLSLVVSSVTAVAESSYEERARSEASKALGYRNSSLGNVYKAMQDLETAARMLDYESGLNHYRDLLHIAPDALDERRYLLKLLQQMKLDCGNLEYASGVTRRRCNDLASLASAFTEFSLDVHRAYATFVRGLYTPVSRQESVGAPGSPRSKTQTIIDESVFSLVLASPRARDILLKIFEGMDRSIQNTAHGFVDLTTAVIQDPRAMYPRLDELDEQAVSIRRQIQILGNAIELTAPQLNRHFRDPNLTLDKLQGLVTRYGEDLRDVLAVIRDHQRPRALSSSSHTPPAPVQADYDRARRVLATIRLSGEFLEGFFPKTAEERDRFHQTLQNTAVMKHTLIVAALTAKIADLPEGRGGFTRKVPQEVRYQKAWIMRQNPAALPTVRYQDTGKIKPDKPAAPYRRRHFISEQTQAQNAPLEEKLWDIYFQRADLEPNLEKSCRALVYQPREFLSGPR